MNLFDCAELVVVHFVYEAVGSVVNTAAQFGVETTKLSWTTPQYVSLVQNCLPEPTANFLGLTDGATAAGSVLNRPYNQHDSYTYTAPSRLKCDWQWRDSD